MKVQYRIDLMTGQSHSCRDPNLEKRTIVKDTSEDQKQTTDKKTKDVTAAALSKK